jgi:hypothetical protein
LDHLGWVFVRLDAILLGKRFSDATGLALLGETVAAVYRPVAAGLEGDLGLLSALGASYRVHFARSAAAAAVATTTAAATTTVTRGFLGSATGRAALGLICEPELVVTFLLSGRENEAAAAFNAGKILVCKFHLIPVLGKTVNKDASPYHRGNYIRSHSQKCKQAWETLQRSNGFSVAG